MNRRQLYLLIALVVTAIAVWWASNLAPDDGESAAPAEASTTSVPPRQTVKASENTQKALLAQITRQDTARADEPKLVRNPFAAASFQPPPPPPAPPPKPAAPPLRFQYQGLLREDDKLSVFLADGAQLLVVHAGDTLAGQYRVEKLTDKELVLIYLPLNVRQTLNFGKT